MLVAFRCLHDVLVKVSSHACYRQVLCMTTSMESQVMHVAARSKVVRR
jgi:hypothetical protein